MSGNVARVTAVAALALKYQIELSILKAILIRQV
jgi:hypothetical protein